MLFQRFIEIWTSIPQLYILIIIAAILIAANLVLTPPMQTEPLEGEAKYVRARQFSEPAMAGMRSFAEHCADCHGPDADGSGTAPALINRPYAVDFRNSKQFHSEVSRQIPAHGAVIAATRGAGDLDFNALERMSKYLRELRRNQNL